MRARAGDGRSAAGKFQRILDNAGGVLNCATGALARLGLARAYALSGDAAQARTQYQDLLENTDPDIPILKQAKREYATLKERQPD
jgi:hypothetical protein